MDVAIAIDAEAVNVTHRTVAAAGGAWNDVGDWVPAAPTNPTIKMAMQPAGGQISGSRGTVNGNALLDLPEGVRQEARWLGWTRAAVVLNDEIQYVGKWYRVLFAWPRAQDGFTRVALGELAS